MLGLLLASSVALFLPTPAAAFISTGDGGWVWQNPLPQGNQLDGVAFVSADHGWAVGEGGTILVTSNGGATWAVQRSSTPAYLSAVAFVNAHRDWAVGGNYNGSADAGVILATTDGGATWSAQSSGTIAYLDAVACADASHGWVVGEGGTILATTSGGRRLARL